MNFDWDQIISIRRGKSLDIESEELILPNDDTFWKAKGRGRKPICIEEPFEGKY